MAKYEVLKDSYLDQPDDRSDTGVAPRYVKAGATVVYDGIPGTSLKPLDAAARQAVEKAQEAKRKIPITDLDSAKARIAELEV